MTFMMVLSRSPGRQPIACKGRSGSAAKIGGGGVSLDRSSLGQDRRRLGVEELRVSLLQICVVPSRLRSGCVRVHLGLPSLGGSRRAVRARHRPGCVRMRPQHLELMAVGACGGWARLMNSSSPEVMRIAVLRAKERASHIPPRSALR